MLMRKVLSVLLAPVLLWAGMGFSLSRHYCLGLLVEEHLYHSEEVCEMQVSKHSDCHEEHAEDHSSCTEKDKGCCEDVWLQVDGIDVINQTGKEWQIQLANHFTAETIPATSLEFFPHFHSIQSASNPDPPGAILGNSQYLASIQRYLI